MNVTPWYPLGAGDGRSGLVTGVQHLLRRAGHPLVADGIFGPATESAVRDVQTSAGLPSTGELDRETWRQVVVPAGPGDSGEAVMAIQATQLGSFIDEPLLLVDGDFGPVTGLQPRDRAGGQGPPVGLRSAWAPASGPLPILRRTSS